MMGLRCDQSQAAVSCCRRSYSSLTNNLTGGGDPTLAEWPIADERPNGLLKRAPVEVHHQINDVAAAATAPAVPELLSYVDTEAIVTGAAARAGADALVTLPPELNSPAIDLVLDRHAARDLDLSGVHGYRGPPPI
jgi:hypothetical protein